MGLPYHIRVKELENGIRTLVIDLPKNMDALSDFLISDIPWEYDGERIVTVIDRVLSNPSVYEEEIGNACRIEIKSDKTRIVNHLYENLEDNKAFNWNYEIDTVELRKFRETNR
ncbi:hypothetical protein [Brevibacillus dissolubilis]|uniref:hypothetical protein n=1 Tax=Brevibacillus dissolubilis TaxID=1844116 RepID=UPI001115E09C|nr:hypothetical protein [Brevibacillus dissolubilis]